jgi:hypothetical protein
VCGDDEGACESVLVCAASSGSVEAVACLLLYSTHTPQPAASAPLLGATAASALSGSVGSSDGDGVVGSVCVFEEVFVTRRRWRRRVRGAVYFFFSRARPHADTHAACLCVLMLPLTMDVCPHATSAIQESVARARTHTRCL